MQDWHSLVLNLSSRQLWVHAQKKITHEEVYSRSPATEDAVKKKINQQALSLLQCFLQTTLASRIIYLFTQFLPTKFHVLIDIFRTYFTYG